MPLRRGEESNLANVAEPSESLRGVCSIGSSLSDYDAISANPAVLTDRRGTNVIFEIKERYAPYPVRWESNKN